MKSAEHNPLQVALVGYGFAGKTFHAPLISVVEGLKLSRFDRPLGLNHERLARVYRGQDDRDILRSDVNRRAG